VAVIVVAEDDRKQAELVRVFLERHGHTCVVAQDGQAALDAVRRGGVDLVLLDVMMPRLDGFDALARLRSECDVPVIMVTARGSENDQLLGLDGGADDYVVKPYSMRQLVARVGAVLRRSDASRRSSGPRRIGNLEIDRDRAELRVGGQPVVLTRREWAIVEALAERPGVVVRRADLAALALDGEASPRTVDMHVSNLRRKLGDDPLHPRIVLTVKGLGYKLSAPSP
jgi:DNA-binding response OmpR family regulator